VGSQSAHVARDETRARAANIFDVARLAGVSHQTVSRVINSHPSVRPGTRQRVEDAIAQLRYRPSTAARALVTRRTRTVGLITSGTPDYGPASTVLGVVAAARSTRYTVSISSLSDAGPDAVRSAVESLLGQAVEAVVLVSGRRSALEAVQALQLEVPLVVVDPSSRSPFRAVAIDQYAGARAAVRHLVELGHQRILHLAGPVDAMDAAERLRGWRDQMAEARLLTEPPGTGDWTPDSGFAFGTEIADRRDFSAVFSANDQMALGLIHALTARGVRVPEDVSVVGFDDIPEAAHFAPPLTTLHQDFDALGRDIMTVLLDELDDTGSSPAPGVPWLVVRRSTAAPAWDRRPDPGRHDVPAATVPPDAPGSA
jgi:DNA-binding LacI/PurR family transcriptional regulator